MNEESDAESVTGTLLMNHAACDGGLRVMNDMMMIARVVFSVRCQMHCPITPY